MAELDPLEMNVRGVQDLVESKVNKVNSGVLGEDEGVDGDKEDILSLDLSDDELLKLRNKWEARYASYEAKIHKIHQENKKYYLGKLVDGSPLVQGDTPIASNLLFEAEETFLPAALSKNPEPVVYTDNTPEGNKIADDVKTMLQYHADQLVFRRKLALMVRQWSIYHLGVLKYGWNKKINDVSIENRKIQDFVFDPDGFVDAYGDMEGYLGERITVTADKLIELFPKHKEYITLIVDSQMGTECVYTEWWTDEYCFSTFKDKVLDKHKNEFFKYDKPQEGMDGQPSLNPIDNEPIMEKGRNHFAQPKKPYTFLSVFSLGEQPHDITGLIEQNIPQQNLVSRQTIQIDRNMARQNNSVAFSENNFTQQTAKQAANAFEKGNPVLVPSGGPIEEAIVRFPAEGFPDAAFKSLEMNKDNLRSIFGTQGISAQKPNDDTTARGMILNQQYDNTRIGGGIGDAIEQVADNAFNWLVQLYYVYYDEPHFAAVMGQMKATEYVTLSSQQLDRQLIVSVSPDSMKPKDEITTMNQASELFQQGAIGPVTYLTVLNFPDPKESAEDGALWQVDKNAYIQLNFPELAQQLQQIQQQMMQAQQQAQQQQLQQEAQSGQQQLQQKEAGAQQGIAHKEAAHQQKLSHKEQEHAQKLALAPPAPAGGVNASPSLKQTPLPK